MSSPPIAVLKFGSSVLHDERDLPRAVSEIYRSVREGLRVVAVVSALGDTTDGLLESARRLTECPAPSALAALLATGESRAAALLALALHRAGIPNRLTDPVQLRLRLVGPPLDGDPVGLNREALMEALRACPVVVLPGFFGLARDGGPGLLGRGGSDLTALFIAREISAQHCRLLKDVPGIYVQDPAQASARSDRYLSMSFETAAQLGAQVVQRKAMQFAHDARQGFDVSAPGASFATRVGSLPDELEHDPVGHRPLRVALLGLGEVGLGVYRHLLRWPDRFECIGAAVRDLGKPRDGDVPRDFLYDDPLRLLALEADVVVEAIGGRVPATRLLGRVLRAGRHVVTANKAVVAYDGSWLAECAAEGNSQLRFSATVGGAVPVLEGLRRLSRREPLRSVSGILNGTCNFVLDRMAEGAELGEAVRSAQAKGLAEADPTDDLGGTDAARKLAILCHEAFGVRLEADAIRCRGIQDLDPSAVRQARQAGEVVRLVASCVRNDRGLSAEVRPRSLPLNHLLADCRDEENRVLIRSHRGPPTMLSGKGAGRWPTSESVMADLLDLSRLDCRALEGRIARGLSARRNNEICHSTA